MDLKKCADQPDKVHDCWSPWNRNENETYSHEEVASEKPVKHVLWVIITARQLARWEEQWKILGFHGHHTWCQIFASPMKRTCVLPITKECIACTLQDHCQILQADPWDKASEPRLGGFNPFQPNCLMWQQVDPVNLAWLGLVAHSVECGSWGDLHQ